MSEQCGATMPPHHVNVCVKRKGHNDDALSPHETDGFYHTCWIEPRLEYFTIVVHTPQGWRTVGNYIGREMADEALARMWSGGNYAGYQMHVRKLEL